MVVRMKNARLGVVHDLPAAIKNALSDSQVFEDFEILRKACCLPDTPPHGGIDVGEMIKTVTQPIAVCRILHDPLLPVHQVESVRPFQRRTRHRYLSSIDCSNAWVSKIGDHRFEPTT